MPLKTLIEFGLSEKEAKTYIALLELEVAKISEIARKTGINRSSTYVVLEGLKKQGLASESIGAGRIKQYVAASPEVIVESAEASCRKQELVLKDLEKIAPELRSLYKNIKHKPKVMVYEGEHSLRDMYYDALRTKNLDDIRVYEDPQGFLEFLPEFIKKDCT